MKTFVVYDTVYGNTQRVADAIAGALPGEVEVLSVEKACTRDLAVADMLIVGSPTHGGSPTPAMLDLIRQLGFPAREDARAAAFDTRFGWKIAENWGFAAPMMAEALEAKGWAPAATPEGFIVRGLRKGPLKKGEVERAQAWGRALVEGSS